jgi:hypothetical protein
VIDSELGVCGFIVCPFVAGGVPTPVAIERVRKALIPKQLEAPVAEKSVHIDENNQLTVM